MKRNVIVVSTNTQSRKDFKDVEVTTLADIKKLLDDAGIDYTNQAFYEGVSKAEYKSDDSILPTNMPFKGSVTNDLVFQLSNANKKISSGAMNPKRQKCFDYIKEHNLFKEVKDNFGLIYTSVSTDNLEKFINSRSVKTLHENSVQKNNNIESTNSLESSFIATVISGLTKLGYIVCKPKCGIKSLSKSEIDDILNQ